MIGLLLSSDEYGSRKPPLHYTTVCYRPR